MGNKKLGWLLIIFMYPCIFAASSPIQKGLDLPSAHEKYARNDLAHAGKIGRGVGFGAHTGGATGSGEHSYNGGAGIPYVQGGAQSNHHPNTHHGGGSCSRKSLGIVTFIMTAGSSLVYLYIGLQR